MSVFFIIVSSVPSPVSDACELLNTYWMTVYELTFTVCWIVNFSIRNLNLIMFFNVTSRRSLEYRENQSIHFINKELSDLRKGFINTVFYYWNTNTKYSSKKKTNHFSSSYKDKIYIVLSKFMIWSTLVLCLHLWVIHLTYRILWFDKFICHTAVSAWVDFSCI